MFSSLLITCYTCKTSLGRICKITLEGALYELEGFWKLSIKGSLKLFYISFILPEAAPLH